MALLEESRKFRTNIESFLKNFGVTSNLQKEPAQCNQNQNGNSRCTCCGRIGHSETASWCLQGTSGPSGFQDGGEKSGKIATIALEEPDDNIPTTERNITTYYGTKMPIHNK